MKITFLLPPVNMSGGIRVVSIYASLLSARGHQVVLVSPRHPRLSWRQRLKRWLSSQEYSPNTRSHFDALSLDHRVLESYRPIEGGDVPDGDVVVATWWETAEWAIKLPPSKGRKVYFVQGHETFEWFSPEQISRCEATYRYPLHKITIAHWLVRLMADKYGDTDVDLVSNAVDHAQFHAVCRGKQLHPTIGFMFSTSGLKGVDVTLAAIRQLKRRWPDLRVISFGQEPMDAVWREAIEYHRDPAQDYLRELYSTCDVWMTASRNEGFNLPAMEAMACRTPVVSTRTGWPEEAIVSGENGWLVDVNDVEALADCTARVLQASEADWRHMSEAAFATVAGSTWHKSTDRFEQALERVIARTDVMSKDSGGALGATSQ